MVLVDTSVWIQFFNGHETSQTAKLDELLSATIIVVGDLILAEILQGLLSDKDYRQAKSLLTALELVSLTSTDLAIRSADHYRTLRKKGITVRKTIDCLIATYCIEMKMPLLFEDKDFDPFVSHLGLKPVLSK